MTELRKWNPIQTPRVDDLQVMAKAVGSDYINVDISGAQGGASTLTTTRHFQTVGDIDSQFDELHVWRGVSPPSQE